ncbi:MAG: hypothetical protein AB1673_14535 [Actinomycetota bacterium]|jgi:hypothetical protein
MTSVVAGGAPQGRAAGGRRRVGLQLTGRDLTLLRWIGEQYCCRGDLLAVLMARHSDDEAARAAGRVVPWVAQRRIAAWRTAGLVASGQFVANTPATVWLTTDGMAAAGLAWRASAPTFATVAHRHAVAIVRAYAEAKDSGFGWVSERELREGLDHPAGGRRDHLPDGVITSTDQTGRVWRTAVEVELTRKSKGRVQEILRGLLGRYDDVIYFAVPAAAGIVTTAAEGVGAAGRVRVRPYPPEALLAAA